MICVLPSVVDRESSGVPVPGIVLEPSRGVLVANGTYNLAQYFRCIHIIGGARLLTLPYRPTAGLLKAFHLVKF